MNEDIVKDVESLREKYEVKLPNLKVAHFDSGILTNVIIN